MYFEFRGITPIPSENFLYHPAVNRKTRRPYLYLDGTVADYKKVVKAAVIDELEEQRPVFPEIKNMVAVYMFGIHEERYLDSDLTNMEKGTEDGMIDGLKEYDPDSIVDDRLSVCSAKFKLLVEKPEDEGFYIFLFINDEDSFIQPHDILIALLGTVKDRIDYMLQASVPFSYFISKD